MKYLVSLVSTQIVDYLAKLASEGMTILCTIHQPSSECFHLFSKLMLLSSGKTIYFGPTEQAVDYFKSTGNEAPLFVYFARINYICILSLYLLSVIVDCEVINWSLLVDIVFVIYSIIS